MNCSHLKPAPTAAAGASTLNKDDVERMVKDAEKNASEDKKRREAVDTKNQVRTLAALTPPKQGPLALAV